LSFLFVLLLMHSFKILRIETKLNAFGQETKRFGARTDEQRAAQKASAQHFLGRARVASKVWALAIQESDQEN